MCIRDSLSRHSHVYAMPDPPDIQVDEYLFSLEEVRYHFFYVTGEDVAYLTDGAGNVYSVGEERPAFLTFLPVSYTHLDVYKRQVSRLR